MIAIDLFSKAEYDISMPTLMRGKSLNTNEPGNYFQLVINYLVIVMLIHSRPEYSHPENVFCFILSIVFVILISVMCFSKDSVNSVVDNYGWNIEKVEAPSAKKEKNQKQTP